MSKELQSSDSDAYQELWLRLTAFLSMKSPETQRTYQGIIAEWCNFLGANAGTKQASAKFLAAKDLHAMAYRKWLENKAGQKPRYTTKVSSERSLHISKTRYAKKNTGLDSRQANATIAKKCTALRRMYRLVISAGLGVKENPFDSDKVPPPSKDAGKKRPTLMVPFEKVMEIVESPEAGTPKGIRDRALLAILFAGGLRRSEAVGLRLDDVKRTNSGTTYLYLRHTKAKKDAEQALPSWAVRYVEELQKSRKQQGAGPGDYLFITYTGQAGKTPIEAPMSDSGLYKLFKLYCRLAGVAEFVSPHSARATAITKLLEDGISHREVQEFSRHSSIQMVEVYDKRRFGVEKNPGRGLNYGSNKKK